MRDVSHRPPQVCYDTLAVVAYVCSGGVEVYDIQVEEAGCFFADSVLVGNCLIIDDPIKDQEEADSAQTGAPAYYADYDYNHWLIVPTPDVAYPYEVLFYQLPVLLDEENQTNWLTEEAPQLLLYAVLLEATPFLKNDDRIPVWQQMYDRAASMLNGEDLAKILDRSAVRKEA